MSASSKLESQLHFLLFSLFSFQSKQARAFLAVGVGFALPSPSVSNGALMLWEHGWQSH